MDRIGRLPMLLNTIPTGIGQVARNAAAMLRQPPCHCIHQPWRCRSPMTIADDDVGGLRGGKRRHRVHVAKQRQSMARLDRVQPCGDTGVIWLVDVANALPDRLERQRPRSEEHTSELQSLMRSSYAV